MFYGGVSLGIVVIALVAVLLLGGSHLKSAHPPLASTPETGAFINAAQELYASMVSAHKAASMLALEHGDCGEHMSNPGYEYTDMVKKYALTWIHLATKMVDALPVMAHIQKSLPQALAQEIRKFETLHALSLVRYKIPNIDCYNFNKHDTSVNRSDDDDNSADFTFTPDPLNPQALFKNFSQSLEIIYPLLINSFKQGLPLQSYLHILGQLEISAGDVDDMLDPQGRAPGYAKQPAYLRLKALRPALNSFLFYDGLDDGEYGAYYTYIYPKLGLDLSAIHALGNYYYARISAFKDEIDAAKWENLKVCGCCEFMEVGNGVLAYRLKRGCKDKNDLAGALKSYNASIKAHPLSLCLNTLSNLPKEFKNSCQINLAHSQIRLKDYLQDFRLLAIGNQPCLYLNPDNTILSFPSKEPPCAILQANLPNMGAPLPKNLLQASSNAQERFLKILESSYAPEYGPSFTQDMNFSFTPKMSALTQSVQALLKATPLVSLASTRNHLLDYESMHLLALLHGSISEGLIRKPTPLFLQEYLRLLDFIYTPLIQASKQGLDLEGYLESLQEKDPPPNLCKSAGCTSNFTPKGALWLQDYHSAVLGARLAAREYVFNGDTGLIWNFAYTWQKNLPLETQEAFKAWDWYYCSRVRAFLDTKDFCATLSAHPERVGANQLRQNITPCFTPQYLNKQTLQTCQRIATKQNFSPSGLKTYLQRYKLLSIHNTPCLYLDSKQGLKGFNSTDSFCQGLQAWALSSPPKVTLPPLFLQGLDRLRARLNTILEDAYKQDPTCKQERAPFFESALPELSTQAYNALNTLPLFVNFKPRNAVEQSLKARIEQNSILELFALLQGSAKDPCHPKPAKPTPKRAQQIIQVWDFIYAPLVRAHAQGLDIAWAVQTLALNKHENLQVSKSKWDQHLKTLHDWSKQVTPDEGKYALQLAQDVRVASLVRQLVGYEKTPELAWDLASVFTKNPPKFSGKKEDTFNLEKYWNIFLFDRSGSNTLDFLAYQRVTQFLQGLDLVRAQLDDPSKLNPVLLYANPSVCLHAQYLRPSMQATCAKLFSQKDYDVTALKAYLQDYLLVSSKGTACLYLDVNKQVRGLNSQDGLCQSLLQPIRQKGWFLHDEGY